MGESVEPVFGQVERLLDAFDLTIGGSGAIAACAAARLGLRTALAAVVGDDLFGRFMVAALAERGVNTEAIVVDPHARTGLTVILSRPGDRAILTFPGTISALTSERVDHGLLTRARHVHVASYFLQRSLAAGLPALFERAHAVGATTSIDPNWDPDERWDGGLEHVLGATDVFLPNDVEAIRMTGQEKVADAACALAARGPLVAVKRGADGALAAEPDGELVEITALPGTRPVDTIGAGDAFDAGLLTALLRGWSTRSALALGSVCGSLSTRAVGGTAAQPTSEEAHQALGKLLGTR